LESILKKVVMVLFEALPWKFPGGTEENHKNISQDSQYPVQDSKWESPRYESKAMPLEQTCLVAADELLYQEGRCGGKQARPLV
jgi:hypothetical protein